MNTDCLLTYICVNLCSSVVAAVGCILRRERLRQSTAKSAIDPSRWWPMTLNANDAVNRVAASQLAMCETVNRNSGSTFCYAIRGFGFNRQFYGDSPLLE